MKNKKTTRAFQLGAIDKPIQAVQVDNKWFPTDLYTLQENTLFIRGTGRVKITKAKKETVEPLLELTAEGIKSVYDKYGINVALGMVNGWGGSNLFHDGSYGLQSTMHEVANMALLGKKYDEFTDKVQVIGDHFVEGLLANGFTLHGDITKGSLWYDYKDENNYGNLTGFVGIYERIPLHPLQHVEHFVGHSFLGGRIWPSFNSISFDDMLVKLFMSRYHDKNNDFTKFDEMTDKIVSVRDRIAHLTSEVVADEIASIFELQKLLQIA